MVAVTRGKHLPLTALVYEQVRAMLQSKKQWPEIGERFNKDPSNIKKWFNKRTADLRGPTKKPYEKSPKLKATQQKKKLELLVPKYAQEQHEDTSNKYPHLSDIRHVLKTKHKLITSNFTVSKICKANGLSTKLKPKKPMQKKLDPEKRVEFCKSTERKAAWSAYQPGKLINKDNLAKHFKKVYTGLPQLATDNMCESYNKRLGLVIKAEGQLIDY